MNETLTIKSEVLRKVEVSNEPAMQTGNSKFDEWFSKAKGLVLRSFIFLTGSPGSGKTTLMVNLMKWAKDVRTSMYSREMRKDDVKSQTSNLKFDHDNAYIADKKTHPHFQDYMAELSVLKPRIVIVDSLQVIAEEDYPDMSLDEACLHIVNTLRDFVAENNAVLILIGHSNKDGTYSGASTIKHLIDAHMELHYDQKANIRKALWSKNRKGIAGVPLFYSFGENGLEFYSEEEWGASKSDRSFSEYIAKHANAYLETLDQENENFVAFKKEYETEMKKINAMYDDGDEHISKIVLMIASLSRKYGV